MIRLIRKRKSRLRINKEMNGFFLSMMKKCWRVLGGRILEQLGYAVTVVLRSNDALDMFKANPQAFDVVITDQSMPGDVRGRTVDALIKNQTRYSHYFMHWLQ